MGNWKRLLTITALVLACLAAFVFALGNWLTRFLVDFWWFSALDYGSYFWLRVLYRYFLSGGVTLLFFLIFFLHFWVASGFLGVRQGELSGSARDDRSKNLRVLFQHGSLKVYAPISLVLAIMIALPFYQHWETALLFLFGPDSDAVDPVYHENVSFYLFQLPIYDLVQWQLQLVSILLLLAVSALYWMEHQMLPLPRREWSRGAKIHLSVLFFATALIAAWGNMLERHDLLNTDAHEPVFFGPGFIEMRYLLPLLWISVITLLAAAGSAILWLNTGKGLRSTVGFAAVFVLSVLLRHVDPVPDMIDRFLIKPNPVKVEREFMENNITATLAAYDLNQVKTLEITASEGPGSIDPHTRRHLHNIPIWDQDYLDNVYQQLQGIRPYYSFTDVDVGRYQINGQTEQVNLAAREINIDNLPAEAQNWENRHLRYTHGYGAVITPAAQTADAPMQWFLRDLNLQSEVGFGTENPDIYFGAENLDYAVVPNKLNIVGLSSVDMDSSQNYSGKGDVPISSLFRKLLFAVYFRDEKLFLSVNIVGNSRMMFRRNIIERIKTLTPYLSLDHDPYIVVTPKRIYWVVDAYTTSDRYPVSKASTFDFKGASGDEEKRFNYIRNSVKVVVDAFDGTVDYYIADPADAIIQGYRRAYPGVFKDMSALPPLLREQLRYPRDFFQVQMGIYAKYHQTDPSLFYQQAETWDFAKVNDKSVKPYYLTTRMDGAEDLEDFILLNPMTPIRRSNLSVLAVGGMKKADLAGGAYRKEIMVYKYSREVQVDGPSQVSTLIDQDTEISRMFALWDQKGSHVERGRIIVLPIGKSLLYVQPVYLVSTTNTKIPELARIILSMGNLVVMETSLEAAVDKLEGKLQEVKAAAAPQQHPVDEKTSPSLSISPM